MDPDDIYPLKEAQEKINADKAAEQTAAITEQVMNKLGPIDLSKAPEPGSPLESGVLPGAGGADALQ